MPINIYIQETFEKLDFICEDIWDLPTQIEALETWLDNKAECLEPNKYVADIGFEIKKDASGGGGVLSSKAMAVMGEIDMDVYFSEYPSAG